MMKEGKKKIEKEKENERKKIYISIELNSILQEGDSLDDKRKGKEREKKKKKS